MAEDLRLKAALAVAGLGWPVLPVRDDKRPRLKDWENQASVDAEEIRAWAARWPATNFAVALGRASLIVVDSDVDKRQKDGSIASGEASLKALEAEEGAALPETFTVRTPSGGTHRYYSAANLGSRNGFRPGLDVKSGGGYVLIPDSVTSRGRYRTVADRPVAALPAWFKEAYGKSYQMRQRGAAPPPDIVPDTEPKLEAARELVECWPSVLEGERNDNLYKMARELCKIGVSEDAAWETLLEYADFVPTLPEREARDTIHSAYSDMSDFGEHGEERAFAAVAELGSSDAAAEAEGEWDPVAGSFAQFLGREPPVRPWLVQDFIPYTHQPVMIAGAPGASKSLLGAQLCREASLGRAFLGRSTIELKSLYITFEDSVEDLFHRASRNSSRINPEGDKGREPYFMYLGKEDFVFCSRSRQSGRLVEGPGYRKLFKWVTQRGIRFIVGDHLSKFFPENENDRGLVNGFGSLITRFCEEAGCLWLMLAHTNKAGLEYSGSSANAGIYRQVMLLTRDESGLYTLECRKSNHTRAGDKLHFVFDDWYCAPLSQEDIEALRQEREDAKEADKAAKEEAREAAREDNVTRIRQVMRHGEWYTAQQLRELTGLDLSPVALGRLINQATKMTGEFEVKKAHTEGKRVNTYTLCHR
jgi:hypothetical protein